MKRLKLALTIGDVAGIGPEITLKACADSRVSELCTPIVVGHPGFLERAARVVDHSVRIVAVDSIDHIDDRPGNIACWNPCGDDALSVATGTLDARAGQAAYAYVVAAARAALTRQVDGMVTAPLNKAALALAGIDYPGHTEILASICGVEHFAMMLYLPPAANVAAPHGLGVAHVTLHTSLASVPSRLTSAGIHDTIELVSQFMSDMGCSKPRVGVCALNPHAGENGLFGGEEARIIAPAVGRAVNEGFDATGPWPADALFRQAADGHFDAVVAMYHDQGHIALKLIAFQRAVNVTLGLPIVRTSPSHGTAFDIAGTGTANAEGMIEAIRVAVLLARRRQPQEATQ